jgi:plastocyanin
MMLAVITLPVYAAGSPQITITSPKEGAILPAGNITVSVQVMNFSLVNKLGQTSVAGEGHIHYFRDVTVPTAPGKLAITAPGTYVPTINIGYTWMNVSPGKHNLSVELVNNDHTPLSPPVFSMVNVTVAPASANMTKDPASVSFGLIAKNIAFNTSTIMVPAGANVTINFDNEDSAIPHNFAVYDTSAAENVIFKGQIITGPKETTYTFTAPSKPGTYFFRCDVHPTLMYGQFIVESSDYSGPFTK